MKTKTTTARKAKRSTVVAKKPAASKPRKTRQEMRVSIAKDVLKQLKAKKFIASPGVWVDDKKLGYLDEYVYTRTEKAEGPIDACTFANGITKCKVCALGSIFVSAARMYKIMLSGSLETEEVFDNLATSPLKRYFSVKQLELIEYAFEGGDGVYIPGNFNDELDGLAFFLAHRTPTDRLEAIMRNIVKNNGTFIPSQDASITSTICAVKELGVGGAGRAYDYE